MTTSEELEKAKKIFSALLEATFYDKEIEIISERTTFNTKTEHKKFGEFTYSKNSFELFCEKAGDRFPYCDFFTIDEIISIRTFDNFDEIKL